MFFGRDVFPGTFGCTFQTRPGGEGMSSEREPDNGWRIEINLIRVKQGEASVVREMHMLYVNEVHAHEAHKALTDQLLKSIG